MSVDRSLRADNNPRSSGVGTLGNYHIPTAQEMLDPDNPENLTAEQIRAAHTLALREDKANQDRLETQKNADAFVAEHPEWIDNQANSQLLVNQAKTMFGDGLLTVDNFESAYRYLREHTNFLALNKTVLAAQQKQASKQRYAAQRAAEANHITNLSEAQLEALPLEEIRRLDAIERQKQMQLAGERGGNGF